MKHFLSWLGILVAFSFSIDAQKYECGQQSSHIRHLLRCSEAYKEPVNMDTIKKQIKEFRTSGRWDQAITCVVDKAYAVLKKYLPVRNKRLALVVDIDDTALSNFDFILGNDFGYNRDRTKKWETEGKDPAIEPVRDLCNYAKKQGFALFFITGRRENQRESTERNLKKAGYKAWDKAYFKPMNFRAPSASGFKSRWREHIVQQGYTIVVSIGDQMSDFEGNPQALANVKLPNPMYCIE